MGGFDDTIRAKGGEDTDLGWRICDLGREAVFVGDAHVFHDVSPSRFRSALREAATMVDIPRVKVVHPERAREKLHQGVFWKATHPMALFGLTGIVAALVLRRASGLLTMLPWVWCRLSRSPLPVSRKKRLFLLPHAFAIDAVEISTMLRGSIKHRTFML